METEKVYFVESSEDYDDQHYGFAFFDEGLSPADIQNWKQDVAWKELKMELRDGESADYLVNDLDIPLCSKRLKDLIVRHADNSDDIICILHKITKTMKYNIFSFRESDDYDKKRYGFAESPDSVDPIDIYQGLPLEKPWSEPMFELTEGYFSDYLSNDCDWVLCSEKLKQCIETNAINATDITWCLVAVNDGDVVKTYYALLMETPMKEILDIEKSRKLRDGEIYLPHFVYDKIKDVDIFALEEEYLGGLYISERLKLIIEAEPLTGVGFEDWYAS